MTNLKKLVQKGQILPLKNYFSSTPLEKEEDSLSTKSSIINKPDEHDDTLVHIAARFHQFEVLKYLVEELNGKCNVINKHGILSIDNLNF